MKNLEKIQKKEQKQLERLRKEQNRSKYSWYYSGLLVCLIMLVIVDSFATNCGNALQSAVVTEFFVQGKGMSFQDGLSNLTLFTSPMLLLSVVATILLSLSDKVGRKPMLQTSALGMVVGMLCIYFSKEFNMYIFGFAIVTLFISFDMHQLYIIEVAPAAERATWSAMSQFFAQMAITSVGIMRLMNTFDGQLAWRNIYLIPAIVGIFVVILLAVYVRESDVFLTQRIAYLETVRDERDVEKKKAASKKSTGGIGKAFAFMFRNKQMRSLFICLLLFRLAFPAFANYYESIMTSVNMSTDAVSIALIFMALSAGFTRLSSGLVSDKLGRKKSATIFGAFAVVTLIGFILSARALVTPVIVGIFLGGTTGAYWTVGDQIMLMMSESCPTAIRGSVTSASGIVQVVFAIVTMVLAGILIKFIELSLFCVVYGAITVAIATVSLYFFVRETNGADLTQNDDL